MSPVSRGRKSKSTKKAARRTRPELPPLDLEPGDSPDSVREAYDLDDLLDGLAADPDLAKLNNPFTAELLGAGLLALAEDIGYGDADAADLVVDEIIEGLEDRGGPAAVVLLLGVAGVAGGPSGRLAVSAADRLVALGQPRPDWAGELAEPVTAGECLRLAHPSGGLCALSAVFQRANRSQAVVILTDGEGGEAYDVLPVDPDLVRDALTTLRETFDEAGRRTEPVELDPAEFRRRAEAALDARAARDREDGPLEVLDPFAGGLEDGPTYPMLARLLRARLAALPASRP
jgi:hypothetical protein